MKEAMHTKILKYVILDLVMAALIFGVFFLFFALLPGLQRERQMEQETAGEETVVQSDPDQAGSGTDTAGANQEKKQPEEDLTAGSHETAAGDDETNLPVSETSASDPTESTGTESLGAEEGVKTELEQPETLREKFAEFFTSEIQRSELSYSSPNVAVEIEVLKDSEHGEKPFTCYVADIHIADISCLKTGIPDVHSIALSEEIAEEDEAILGVNGDYYVAIKKGLLVRNGEVLQEEEGTSDLCILYQDGRMVTCGPEEYLLEDLIAEKPYQIWSFGPALLDENGEAKTEFNTSRNLSVVHPRTALGYYEPGHYCFVVIDGRGMGNSAGATMEALSRLMADLGCTAAYNLDGGASSSMVFDGQVISRPSGGRRRVSDMVLICDLPTITGNVSD